MCDLMNHKNWEFNLSFVHKKESSLKCCHWRTWLLSGIQEKNKFVKKVVCCCRLTPSNTPQLSFVLLKFDYRLLEEKLREERWHQKRHEWIIWSNWGFQGVGHSGFLTLIIFLSFLFKILKFNFKKNIEYPKSSTPWTCCSCLIIQQLRLARWWTLIIRDDSVIVIVDIIDILRFIVTFIRTEQRTHMWKAGMELTANVFSLLFTAVFKQFLSSSHASDLNVKC